MTDSDGRPERLRRSLLFVPGSDPRKIDRARDARADTLLLDLEDAVAPPQKDEARKNVAAALRDGDFGETERAARVNAPGTPYFDADVQAVIEAGAQALMLPKCESAEALGMVIESIERYERGRNAVALLALVESPAGIANAFALARARRIDAVCFGHADFSLQMGLAEADASRGIVHHARCQLVIAAKAGGAAAIDCVHLAVKDLDAFRADAEHGLGLGYEGKLCIHPAQAEIANQVYTPTREQVERALRVLEAWETTRHEGVITLDGKMIDTPLVEVQRRVLERARRAGALPR